MRRYSLLNVTSSTSVKLVVCGASVGGRVQQTRGVNCSAPNCTVSSIATSKEMIRPVILSSPAKTAVGLRMRSASAEPPVRSKARPLAAMIEELRCDGMLALRFGSAANPRRRAVTRQTQRKKGACGGVGNPWPGA
jgi:molybdopterin biosynthesis enzyme